MPLQCSILLRSAGLMLMLLGVVVPPRARAQVALQQIVLEAELPESLRGCVSASLLEQGYRRALAAEGGEGSADPEVPLLVHLRARDGADADTTLLELEASAAGRPLGLRTLPVRTRDCAALPDALALVLVLLSRAAGPTRQAASTAPAPPPAARATEPSAATGSATAPSATAPRRPRPETRSETVAIGAGAGVWLRALPRAALALQLQAATRREPLALRLTAALLWPQELGVAEGFIQTRGYELALEVCSEQRVRSLPRLALRLCLGPRFGLLVARGRQFQLGNQRAHEFSLHLGMLPEALLRIAADTWLQLGAGGAVALVRPQFGVGLERGQRRLSLAAPGPLRAELGLSLVQIF